MLENRLHTTRLPDWKRALVACIYKKGDTSNPANYRPISLLVTAYKLYARILQARLSAVMEAHLRSTQYGFRKGKSTADPIHIARRVQEAFEDKHSHLYYLFLDWQMAFDRVSHAALLSSLLRLGVPEHFCAVVSDIYTNPTFQVSDRGLLSQSASCQSGIR